MNHDNRKKKNIDRGITIIAVIFIGVHMHILKMLWSMSISRIQALADRAVQELQRKLPPGVEANTLAR